MAAGFSLSIWPADRVRGGRRCIARRVPDLAVFEMDGSKPSRKWAKALYRFNGLFVLFGLLLASLRWRKSRKQPDRSDYQPIPQQRRAMGGTDYQCRDLDVLDARFDRVHVDRRTVGPARADYAEVVTEFVVRVMFIGFFAALLAFGPGWAQAIINSLSDIAQQSTIAAGGAAANPTNIFDTGEAGGPHDRRDRLVRRTPAMPSA